MSEDYFMSLLFYLSLWQARMPYSGMLHRVAIVRTDVSEECNAPIILVFLRSVRRLLVTANVVLSSPIFVTLMMEALRSSETSVLTIGTRRNIQEDTILHSPRRENLKSDMIVRCP
jgi:hypothetical protein